MPTVFAGTPGEEQIKLLKPAIDSKGRKVGEEWFTTRKVEDALMRLLFIFFKTQDPILLFPLAGMH